MVQARRNLLDCQHTNTGGGEFDCEWDAAQSLANLGDGDRILIRQSEVGSVSAARWTNNRMAP